MTIKQIYSVWFSGACFSLLLVPSTGLPGQSLEVRRAHKEFVEEMMPERLAALEKAVGFAHPIEFDFDTIQAAEEPIKVYKALPSGAVYYVVSAFAKVSSDELGKEAIQEKIKKIRFVHTIDPEQTGVSLDDEGTLTLSMDGTSGHSEIALTAVKEFLEKNL